MADYLVSKGLPFREAHRLAGRLVARLAAEGRPFAEATIDELQEISPSVRRRLLRRGRPGPGGGRQDLAGRNGAARVGEQLALARGLGQLSGSSPPESAAAAELDRRRRLEGGPARTAGPPRALLAGLSAPAPVDGAHRL